MKTQLLIPAVLRKYANEQLVVEFDGNSVGELLQEIKRAHPDLHNCICDETGRMRQHINLFLDDEMLDRNDFDKQLDPGVVVSLFQAVSGG